VQQHEELVLRAVRRRRAVDDTLARHRSIFSDVTSSTRIAPKARTRWAETIER
jgi:hypothetical protein